MILNKKYFALSALALLATFFAACSDDDPSEVYVGDMPQYQKAYITTGVSSPNGSSFRGSFPSEVQITEDGKLAYVVLEDEAMRPATSFDSDVYFRTNFAVQKTISGTIAVVSDPEAFLAQYNAEHKTECKLLPAEFYTIGDGHVTIEAGSKSSEAVHVAVDTELKWELGEYLLPLGLTLDSGAEIEPSKEKSLLCLKYTISSPSCRFLSPDEITTESTASGAANAADANRSTTWTSYGDLYIKLKEPQCISRICLLDCTSYYYVWMLYEDASNYIGGYYFYTENESGLTNFNPAQINYDASRKVKEIVIRNYYGSISDIYILVND